jgi:tape measure domain-containing protein
MKRKSESTSRSANALARSLRFVGVGLGVGAALNGLRNYADAWVVLNNKVKIATGSQKNATIFLDKLHKVARTTGSTIDSVATTFSRLSLASKGGTHNLQQMLRVTEILNKQVLIGGNNSREAGAGLIQFSQGIASGKLQGDELRSVMENLLGVQQGLIEGFRKLKEAGTIDFEVTKANIRDLASEGVLNSHLLIEALLAVGKETDESFKLVEFSFQNVGNRVANSVKKAIGESRLLSGVFSTLKDGITAVADGFGSIVKVGVIAAATMAAFYLSIKLGVVARAAAELIRLEIALGAGSKASAIFSIALKRATVAVRLFTAALASNPLGLFIIGITSAIGYLVAFSDEIKPIEGSIASLSDYAAVAFDYIANKLSGLLTFLSQAWVKVVTTVSAAVDQFVTFFSDALQQIKAQVIPLYNALTSAVVDFVAGSVSLMVASVSSIIAAWNMFPAALKDITIRAGNGAIEIMNKTVRGIVSLLNYLPAIDIDVNSVGFDKFENAYSGAASRTIETVKKDFNETFNKTFDETRVNLNRFGQDVVKSVIGVRDHLVSAAKTWKELAEARAESSKELPFRDDVFAQRQSANTVFKDYISNIEREIKLLKLTSFHREVMQETIKAENALLRKKVKITDSQRTILQDVIKLRQLQSRGSEVTEEFLDDQSRLNAQLHEYVRLRRAGTISEETFQRAMTKTYQQYDLVLGSMDSLNAKIIEASNAWADTLTDVLVEAAMTGKLSFKDMADQIIKDMLRIAIRAMTVKPLLEGFGGYFNLSGFGGASNPSNPSTGGPPSVLNPASSSNAVVSKAYTTYQQGLIRPQNTLITRAATSPSPSSAGVKVNVHNYVPGTETTAERKSDGKGGFSIEVMVEKITDKINNNTLKGKGVAPSMEQRYGLNPAAGAIT